MDTPANERWYHEEGNGEEEEVTDTMATMEEDAMVVGTVVAG